MFSKNCLFKIVMLQKDKTRMQVTFLKNKDNNIFQGVVLQIKDNS